MQWNHLKTNSDHLTWGYRLPMLQLSSNQVLPPSARVWETGSREMENNWEEWRNRPGAVLISQRAVTGSFESHGGIPCTAFPKGSVSKVDVRTCRYNEAIVHRESPALALFENCSRQAAAMELVITEQPAQQGRGWGRQVPEITDKRQSRPLRSQNQSL